MGYTHYITGCDTLSKNELLDWIAMTNKIIAHYNKRFKEGDEKRIVNCQESIWKEESDIVLANGFEDNGHETLYISAKGMGNFEFCKTARKPYDSVVVASYLYASDKFKNVTMSSDGHKSDMKKGKNLLCSVSKILEPVK